MDQFEQHYLIDPQLEEIGFWCFHFYEYVIKMDTDAPTRFRCKLYQYEIKEYIFGKKFVDETKKNS